MTTSTLSTATKKFSRPAEASGTFLIGDIPVHRLGFGAMQLTGDGVWGEPDDHSEAIAVLRRALELGINLIDTADSYGPEVSERLIAEALHPYPKGLVPSIYDRLSRAAWAGCVSSESIYCNCTGSIRK